MSQTVTLQRVNASRTRVSSRVRARARGPAVRRNHGFSLIELLVAVLVMGIGVLGVSALQMVSLQNNRAALVRAEAVQLAYDMMDRIRANPAGDPAGSAYDGLGIGDGPPNPPGSHCRTANCSAAQLVNLDQAVWKCSLGAYNGDGICANLFAAGQLPAGPNDPDVQQAGLPSGDGAIAVDGAGVIRITVQWTEPDGQLQTVTIDSQG